MANVFKRGGKWYVRYLDPGGKDKRVSIPGVKTRREAELEMAKLVQKLGDGSYRQAQRQAEITLAEICNDFLAYSRAHKRSYNRDERSVADLLRYFGDVTCVSVNRSMVESFIATRRDGKPPYKKPVKPSSVNRELACLKTVFRRAVIDEKLTKNPLMGFKLLPEDNVRDRVLEEDEYQRLLFASPKHIQPVLILAWETGMRRGEILNLRWQQVDLKEGVIKLAGSETKSGRGREVPLSPAAYEAVRKLKRSGEKLFTHKGRPMRDIRTAFARGLKAAKITGFRFHDLRHCFVTRMRRKGVPDRVIMQITGHRTFECFRRYDTISLADLKGAVGSS